MARRKHQLTRKERICDLRSATAQEFAEEIGVSVARVYGMVKSDKFQELKIAHSLNGNYEKNRSKYNNWRIDVQKYYAAREKGLL